MRTHALACLILWGLLVLLWTVFALAIGAILLPFIWLWKRFAGRPRRTAPEIRVDLCLIGIVIYFIFLRSLCALL